MSNPPESEKDEQAIATARWNIERIEGYLQLGMVAKARSLLAALPAWTEDVLPTDVLILRLDLASHEEDWAAVAVLSKQLHEHFPENPNCIIQWAYATRRAVGIDEARKILEQGLRRFPRSATIHYNLGCYACVKNELDRAKQHLIKAFELDETYIDLGLEDEDLDTLRDFIIDALED